MKLARYGFVCVALLGLVGSLLCLPASAAIVAGTTSNADFNGFAVNTTNDLILQGASTLAGGQPTWSGSFDSYSGSSPAVLNDGIQHSGQNSTTTAVSAPSNADWTLTYNLNTVLSPSGYSISQITTDAIWTNDYAGQSYTLSYTPVGGSLTTVGDYGVQSSQANNGARSTEIQLTSDNTNPILSNVASLQFVFHPAVWQTQLNQGAYTQITVTGTATPEPSTVVLFGLGAVGLWLAARRRRSA